MRKMKAITWLKTRVWPVTLRTWQGWQEDDGFLLSAAMAYYAAFSLFPLLLVLIAGLGVVMRLSPQTAQDAQQTLLGLLGDNEGLAGAAGPWLADQLRALLTGVKTRAGLGGPIGAVALVAAAIGMFIQFDYIFDRIWNIHPPESKSWLAYLRSILWDRVSAFLMLLSVSALLLAVFLANLVLAGIRPYVVQLPAGTVAWQWGQIGFTLVTNALLFGIIYKVLPKARVWWRHALTGGALVSLVWILGQQLLVSFVIGTHYSAYGVVGSFMAVMLWLYYAGAVIFLGAELVQALSHEPRSTRS
jgi:membrane protein